MKKYDVEISYKETTYIQVEAENEQEAEEKAQAALDRGEVESSNSLDEPDYEFYIEEVEDDK